MNDRTITVKGTGSVTAKPDLIVITMKLENTDPSYSGAMEQANHALERLRTALTSAGYAKDDLKTADFRIGADYENYRDDKNNWRQKFVGYQCVHALKLELDLSMERLGKTLAAIAESGADPTFEIRFSVKDKNAVTRQLLENAVKNAGETAAILAGAAGVTLGAIRRIDYDWGEISLYSDTRIAEPLGSPVCAAAAMDMEPEDIQVNDTVTVIWEIG